MRQILLAALAAAAIVAGEAPRDRAAAMVPAHSLPPDLAAHTGLVRRAVNVCGTNGCVRVQTQRIVKRHPPPLPQPHH